MQRFLRLVDVSTQSQCGKLTDHILRKMRDTVFTLCFFPCTLSVANDFAFVSTPDLAFSCRFFWGAWVLTMMVFLDRFHVGSRCPPFCRSPF